MASGFLQGGIGGAAQGAEIGSTFGLPGTIVGGIAGFLLGGAAGASAQSTAENEAYYRQQMFNAQRAQAESERNAILQAGMRSPLQQKTLSDLLNYQSIMTQRSMDELNFLGQRLDTTQPGSMAAGQGLLAGALSRQRAAERTVLESSLRQRLGAGYATTAAGQAALQQFDQGSIDQTAKLMPELSKFYLESLMTPANYENQLRTQELGALKTAPSMVPYAGGQYLQDFLSNQASGQRTGQMFSDIFGAAGQYVGYQRQSNMQDKLIEALKANKTEAPSFSTGLDQNNPMTLGSIIGSNTLGSFGYNFPMGGK